MIKSKHVIAVVCPATNKPEFFRMAPKKKGHFETNIDKATIFRSKAKAKEWYNYIMDGTIMTLHGSMSLKTGLYDDEEVTLFEITFKKVDM